MNTIKYILIIMNRQNIQALPQRTLQDILRDLNACENRCQTLTSKNQRQFDCLQRKVNLMAEGWSSHTNQQYFI